MNKSSYVVDLRPNRLLLDPSFGGYKLSLDSIPTHQRPLETGVDVVQPSDDQYSFQHVKIFSLHNHLHVNPHKPNDVYYVDKEWNVFKVSLSPLNQPLPFLKVFQIPNMNRQKGNYNISIKFPAPDTAVVADGAGTLHFAKLNEQNVEEWVCFYSGSLGEEKVSCVLGDAKIEIVDNNKCLHVILLHVEEKETQDKDNKKDGLFHTVLEWGMFTEREGGLWGLGCIRKLIVNGSVDYVALEPGCEGTYVISDSVPKWVFDSANPIKTDKQEPVEVATPKIYSWTQTNDDITLWLLFPEETEKSDVTVDVEELKITIKLKDEVILSGNLFHRIDKSLTSWVLEKSKLELQLTKVESGLMWKTLIPEDERGEEIIDPEVVKNIHEKLAHLCSEEESGAQPSFNSQQLEDCDSVSCDTTSLVRLHSKNHSVTHEVNLSSSQWLFKVHCEPTETPAICCRHDVDACVWQFKKATEGEKTWPHEHTGTFSAFGYVQASKTQKKFIASAPNLSYVAVCEASHHIYIYRQPSPLNSELKNRHTGKKVETISKQQLVNLQNNKQILGVHATNNILYVLLEDSLCVLVINT